MVNRGHTCVRLKSMAKINGPVNPTGGLWPELAQTILKWKWKTYLIVVDNISHCFKIRELQTTWNRHTYIVRDLSNPQDPRHYHCWRFKEFSKNWSFTHINFSPLQSQTNVVVETAVQTDKNILKKEYKCLLQIIRMWVISVEKWSDTKWNLDGEEDMNKTANNHSKPLSKTPQEELIKKEEKYQKKYIKHCNPHYMVQIQIGNSKHMRPREIWWSGWEKVI